MRAARGKNITDQKFTSYLVSNQTKTPKSVPHSIYDDSTYANICQFSTRCCIIVLGGWGEMLDLVQM